MEMLSASLHAATLAERGAPGCYRVRQGVPKGTLIYAASPSC